MSFARTPANKTLREVFASLRNHKKYVKNIAMFLACFTDKDIVRLITTSKELSATLIAFPLNHYRFFMAENSKLLSEGNLLFHCIRDYVLLKQMQHVLKDGKTSLSTPQDIIEKLTSTKLPYESKITLSAPDSSITWKRMIAANRRQTMQDAESARAILIKRLTELKIPHPDKQADKIQKIVAHHTAVVTAFPLNKFPDLKSGRLVNYFSVKSREKTSETFDKDGYYWQRQATELFHFQPAPPNTLMAMSLDATAHPCYATLQFKSNIHLLSDYGESFIVFQPTIKQLVCASAGPGFLNNNRYYTIDNEQWLAPLIAKFSDDLLRACANTDTATDAIKNISLHNSSVFIEVLLPANIELTDPRYVQHVNFGYSGHFSLRDMDEFRRKGISVSVGDNPFTSTAFCTAYHSNQLDKFLIPQVVKQIERAVLHIGETTAEFVQVNFDYRTLQLIMKIHPNNALFHQAQAAAIIYLFGVDDYFKTTSAMQFHRGEKNPIFIYTLTLNGMARKQGKLTDQDAYTCEYDSLRMLLSHLLKRVFSIALVAKQNADYLAKFNKPHPLTGKGPTEESNQTKPLHLGDEKETYDIRVNWVLDVTEIEVISQNSAHIKLVSDALQEFGLTVSQHNNCLLIPMPLAKIFAKLEKRQCHYQATVVYEDQSEQTGCLLLALRNGYTTQGGHSPNPYPNPKHAEIDNEFGDLIEDVAKINSLAKEMRYTSSSPKTYYLSLPTSCYKRISADPHEFAANSLDRFAVYEMGNLNPRQLRNAAHLFDLSPEMYVKHFGKSLLLRPLPAIFEYLEDCEKTLEQLLRNILSGKIDYPVVQIRQGKATVLYRRRQYWKPEQDFGKIEITASENTIDLIIHYFKTEFPQKFSIKILSLTSILFININPFELITILKAAPKQFATHPKEEKSKHAALTQSSDLDSDSLIKRAEKILMADANRIKMSKFLGIKGAKYLNEFLLALDGGKSPDAKADAKAENPLTPEQRNLFNRAIEIICKEAKFWCHDATLLFYALKDGLLPTIKFLIENKHCDPRRISREWTARSYVDYLYNKYNYLSPNRDKTIRSYIHQICSFDSGDWFHNYRFFFHTPSKSIKAFPKIVRDNSDEICEMEPDFELDDKCKEVEESGLKDVLRQTFETTPPLFRFFCQQYEVDVDVDLDHPDGSIKHVTKKMWIEEAIFSEIRPGNTNS